MWMWQINEVQKYCVSIARDRFEADDLTQIALLKGLIYQDKLENLSCEACRAWLCKVARNAMIDVRRKERFSMPFEYAPFIEQAENDDLSVIEVTQMLGLLPPEQSELLTLRYISGMNSVQIGEYLGVPPSTVRTRLRAAVSALKREYARIEM